MSIVVGANPCEHGGRCLNTKGSFQCKCLQGYEGPRCEMDVNECMSNPCHNDATCLDQIGGFHCICMPGKRMNPCDLRASLNIEKIHLTNNSFNLRIRGCVLPHEHRWVCQPALSQQWQVCRQDQLLPLRVPKRWENISQADRDNGVKVIGSWTMRA